MKVGCLCGVEAFNCPRSREIQANPTKSRFIVVQFVGSAGLPDFHPMHARCRFLTNGKSRQIQSNCGSCRCAVSAPPSRSAFRFIASSVMDLRAWVRYFLVSWRHGQRRPMGCQRITAPHRGVGRMFQRSGGVGGQLERPGKMFASNGLEDGGSRAL